MRKILGLTIALLLITSSAHAVFRYNPYTNKLDNLGDGSEMTGSVITVSADSTLTQERQIDGTANQVTITDTGANGRLNIGTSQDIATVSTPRFARIGLGNAANASATIETTTDVASGFGNIFAVSSTSTGFSTDYETFAMINDNTTANNYATFGFGLKDSGGTRRQGAQIIGLFTDHTTGSVDADLVFRVRVNNAQEEVMRLQGTKIGVRTTQPQSDLQVDGTARVTRIGVGVSTDETALITTRGQVAVSLDNYGASAGNTGEIRFKELAANGNNYVAVKASDDIAANVTWTLPTADGTVGQILSTGGDGILRWAADAGGTASGWTDGGTVIRLDTSTDDVVVGGTASLGKLGVLGDSDEAQLVVRSNGTQTSPIMVVENPSGVDFFSVYGNPAMTGANNTIAGLNAGDSITTATDNVCIGKSAGTQITTVSLNTIIGANAGASITTTATNSLTAVGYNAANALTTGSYNTFVGYETGLSLITGSNNTIMGLNAARTGTAYSDTTAIGFRAANVVTGADNTCIGSDAGLALTSGTGNVIIGRGCADVGGTMSSSVIIGANASGIGSNAGSGNVIIGNLAAGNITTGSGNVCIGPSSGLDITTGSNNFVAGDAGADAINDVYFGEGIFDATPTAYTIHGTNGTGTNIAGADLQLAGGQGTGTGAGGKIRLRVAPAGATGTAGNASEDVLTVTSTRNILIRTSSDFAGVVQIGTPDDGVGINVSIDALQAGVTTADTFISFDSKTGEEGSIAGTGVGGVIAFNTFTGSHWSHIDDKEDIEDSMVLIATGEKWHTKQQLVKSAISTKAKDPRVYGVYGGTNKDGYDYVLALGTAFIWVVPTNGDILIGDYLESSDVRGHAQKQDEPVLLNSTVAKALESVNWVPGEKRRKIACTLHAG